MQDWDTALEDLNRLRRDIDEAVRLYVTVVNMIYVQLRMCVLISAKIYDVPTCTHSTHSLTAKHTIPDAPAAVIVADPLEPVCVLQPFQGTGHHPLPLPARVRASLSTLQCAASFPEHIPVYVLIPRTHSSARPHSKNTFQCTASFLEHIPVHGLIPRTHSSAPPHT